MSSTTSPQYRKDKSMPVFFLCFIVFILWLRVKTKQSSKASVWDEEYWQKEYNANFSRKKDLTNLDYIAVDLDKLPQPDGSEEEASIYEDLQNITKQPILNLSHMSNADLKLAYGLANFEKLTIYDQNYTKLIRTLNKWGVCCFNNGDLPRAKQILVYAIEAGSDITATYVTLANIYLQEDAVGEIQALIDRIDQTDSFMKESIREKLMQVLRTY